METGTGVLLSPDAARVKRRPIRYSLYINSCGDLSVESIRHMHSWRQKYTAMRMRRAVDTTGEGLLELFRVGIIPRRHYFRMENGAWSMEFLDRIDECRRFQHVLESREGALACLYGRRRIGKSRLLDEVLKGRADVALHVADRSEVALQRARLANDIAVCLPGFADVRYDNWGTLFDRWRRDAPSGSVLAIDELPYLVEQSPELPSVLQRTADGLRTSRQKLFLCGSSQRMMQGLVLGASEPLYGRAQEIVKLGPISYAWTKKAFPGLSAWKRFERYAVWGGVPRYWEVCEVEKDLWNTLREQVFSPQGLFHEEPTFVLQDDLRDSVQAASVLALIGQGVARPAELAGRLQVPATALGRPLRRLLDLGLISREIPFGCAEKTNKRTLYRISDPFLRFWYTFGLPNYSDPYYLSSPEEVEAVRPAFQVFLGQAWESLVRETLCGRPLPGCEGRWRNISRWWGIGRDRKPMEIDIVAESVDRRTLLVGEVKLSLAESELCHVKRNLEGKVARLPFASRYEHIDLRVFVAKGCPCGAISLDWADWGGG